jgi:hypothetical protein
MNLSKFCLIATLLLAARSVGGQSDTRKPAKPRRPTPSASLTLSAEHTTFKSDSPIKIRVVIKNTWNDEILVPYESSCGYARLIVLDSASNLAPETEQGKEMNGHGQVRGGKDSYAKPKPEETVDYAYPIEALYNLKPGTYTIQADSRVWAIGSPEVEPTPAMLKSNILTITVTE